MDTFALLRNSIIAENKEQITAVLEEISHKGDSSFIVPLIEIIRSTTDLQTRNQLFGIFNELKQESAIPILISAIENENEEHIVEGLIASCWQNGLNYSVYLSFFVNYVINYPFKIAFEAFTVIENMYGIIDDQTELTSVQMIESAIPDADEYKLTLLKELLVIIPNIPLIQDPVEF